MGTEKAGNVRWRDWPVKTFMINWGNTITSTGRQLSNLQCVVACFWALSGWKTLMTETREDLRSQVRRLLHLNCCSSIRAQVGNGGSAACKSFSITLCDAIKQKPSELLYVRKYKAALLPQISGPQAGDNWGIMEYGNSYGCVFGLDFKLYLLWSIRILLKMSKTKEYVARNGC